MAIREVSGAACFVLKWFMQAARRPIITFGVIFLFAALFHGGLHVALTGLALAILAELMCVTAATMLGNYRMLYYLEEKLQREGVASYEEINSEELGILTEDVDNFLGHSILPRALSNLPQRSVSNRSYRIFAAKPEAIVARLRQPEVFPRSDGKTVVFLPFDPRQEELDAWDRFLLYHELEHASSWGIVNEHSPDFVIAGTLILCISAILATGLDPIILGIGACAVAAAILDNAIIRPGLLEARTDLRALMRLSPEERYSVLGVLVNYFEDIFVSTADRWFRVEAGQRAALLSRQREDKTWLSEIDQRALRRRALEQETSDPSWLIASCLISSLCIYLVAHYFDSIGWAFYVGIIGLAAAFLYVTTRSYSNAAQSSDLASNLIDLPSWSRE